MIEKFCDNQTKCTEDTEDTWTCIDNLGEGRVFQCPHKSWQDMLDSKYFCEGAEEVNHA